MAGRRPLAAPATGGLPETPRFRQLGLGYANLGALLMALGLPYDSDAGRAYAARRSGTAGKSTGTANATLV